MLIQHSELDRRGNVISREPRQKVSLARKGDSIFFDSKSELDEKLPLVQQSLAKNDLTVVESKLTQLRNGGYRSFIGDLEWVRPTTEID